MRIGITGGRGQLGFHLHCHLAFRDGYSIAIAGRETFSDWGRLREFVSQCDTIVHLAGVNRGTDAEIDAGNREPALLLAEALQKVDGSRHVIYASSIQRENDTVYGAAKAAVSEILAAAGQPYLEVILPNLFGEYTSPFYNSFVATFCRQIASGDEPTVHGDRPVELLHYCDVAEFIRSAIAKRQTGTARLKGIDTSVSEIAVRMMQMHADYSHHGIVPDLRDPLDLQLFNSYRSGLFPEFYPFKMQHHVDARGGLFECVKERNGGQAFFSTTRPGITRGNHFHFQKVERFIVVSGQARISLRKLFSSEPLHFDVSGEEPAFVDIPTLHAHSITNIGNSDLLTLFWTHEIFDPEAPDTYREEV